MIEYAAGLDGVEAEDLEGFFEGWPAAPGSHGLLRILEASTLAVLAHEDDHVVGFVSALSDGLLAVYIPLLEVRASHRHQGIGSELVRRVLAYFDHTYMVDAVCDAQVAPFYERLGMTRLAGMAHRNRHAAVLQRDR